MFYKEPTRANAQSYEIMEQSPHPRAYNWVADLHPVAANSFGKASVSVVQELVLDYKIK